VGGVLFDRNQTTLIEYPAAKVATSYAIPNSVTSIQENAFNGCTSLTNVAIPNSVTNIWYQAFYSCSTLTGISVDTNNPVYSSVDGVLFDKTRSTLIEYPTGNGATSYAIPNSVTAIGDYAFAYNTSLTSVTIPNSVTSIASGVFNSCANLTNVTIPNGVTSIGDAMFGHCVNLTSVTMPNSVTDIGGYAFAYCTSLTNVTIGNSVARIGYNAFDSCTSLTSVTIPNGVMNIGFLAFAYCASLTNVTIGNSVAAIGGNAFFYCTSLTSMTIPDSVIVLGYDPWGDLPFGVFKGCTNLARVYFQGNAPGGSLFDDPNAHATAYYLPGTTGWGSTFGGTPTALWTLPYPVLLKSSVGVQSSQFGFTVSWATNLSVVVEAATDLGNPIWSPLATNALTGGTFYFGDAQWTKYPTRFYRVRSQ
jgi:hypothetical protein